MAAEWAARSRVEHLFTEHEPAWWAGRLGSALIGLVDALGDVPCCGVPTREPKDAS